MSFLDCSCISHAQVQPLDIEERYEDTSHQFLSCDGSEYTLQGPAGGDDITGLSPEPAHYQLLSELGRGFNNLSQVNMARHTPTGQLVAVKQTNLGRVHRGGAAAAHERGSCCPGCSVTPTC
ncbi:STE20-related kinase adapter protein beta [Larimichthys crocea]|uniref:Uncharacterized protein n=1 Tax=Larimichthys crocea TaxID=215358 RepID=A0ACD3QXG0_LARCR|nr:STE20-related kinase adapter protein beta [Larimichthys crocea]